MSGRMEAGDRLVHDVDVAGPGQQHEPYRTSRHLCAGSRMGCSVIWRRIGWRRCAVLLVPCRRIPNRVPAESARRRPDRGSRERVCGPPGVQLARAHHVGQGEIRWLRSAEWARPSCLSTSPNASASGIRHADARELFEELELLTEQELLRCGEFVLPGVVKLVVQQRKRRLGRNPATGATVEIPAKQVVKARIAKQLKDVIEA